MSAKTPIFRPDSLAFISSAIFPSLGAPKPHLDALAFVARTRISLSTLFTAQAPGCAHYAQLPRRRAAERPFAFIATPRTKWADFSVEPADFHQRRTSGVSRRANVLRPKAFPSTKIPDAPFTCGSKGAPLLFSHIHALTRHILGINTHRCSHVNTEKAA